MGIPKPGRAVSAALASLAFAALCLSACGQKKPGEPNPGVTGTTGASLPADPSRQPQSPAAPSPDATSDFGGSSIGSIAISAEPGSNGGRPVDVDFVAALDDAAAAEIGALSAEDWFVKREAIVGEEKADVMSWRVDPGGSVPETPVELGEATASFVFAHYSSPGAHRKKVEGEGALEIILGADDFTVDVGQ